MKPRLPGAPGRLVVVAVVVVLAGCGAPLAEAPSADAPTAAEPSASGSDANGTVAESDRTTTPSGETSEPDAATLAPDADIDVNATDGLDSKELNRTVGRAMARIEQLRDRSFEKRVPVRVVSREAYRANRSADVDPVHSAWNNQVWEGLLLVGEDRNVTRVFDETLGSAVLGYYSTEDDQIVVVSDSEEPRINRGTLVHELVHALQDQRFGLDESPPTQDEQLARNGVVEGEARLLERRYQERCGEVWDCVETDAATGGATGIDPGLLDVLTYPYVVGPEFVRAIERGGGWTAVDELHAAYPNSTEQVTRPSLYPDETPTAVTVPDRSSTEWKRFDHDPVGDVLGQASLYVMLAERGALDAAGADGPYTSNVTEAWEGDRLVPYRNGSQYGYVWELAWSSPEAAERFASAYRDALDRLGATSNGAVYTIAEPDPFADAFRITRDENRVRIVNAPTAEDLDAVHDRPGGE